MRSKYDAETGKGNESDKCSKPELQPTAGHLDETEASDGKFKSAKNVPEPSAKDKKRLGEETRLRSALAQMADQIRHEAHFQGECKTTLMFSLE